MKIPFKFQKFKLFYFDRISISLAITCSKFGADPSVSSGQTGKKTNETRQLETSADRIASVSSMNSNFDQRIEPVILDLGIVFDSIILFLFW